MVVLSGLTLDDWKKTRGFCWRLLRVVDVDEHQNKYISFHATIHVG